MERHVHFGGSYGSGLLTFLADADLLGKRVAYHLSNENECGWNAINDVQYERDHATWRARYGEDEVTWLW